jgi:DNA-binding MarR family transcriptional regulator
MQPDLKILQVIYEIVSNDPEPLAYQCRPRELILRLLEDWSIIHQHIQLMEQEGLVRTKQLDTLVIFLTERGIELAKGLVYSK